MTSYPIRCSNCEALALFKIASVWTDGLIRELKSYGFACPDCVEAELASAVQRRAVCRIAPGEVIETPEVYPLSQSKITHHASNGGHQ